MYTGLKRTKCVKLVSIDAASRRGERGDDVESVSVAVNMDLSRSCGLCVGSYLDIPIRESNRSLSRSTWQQRRRSGAKGLRKYYIKKGGSIRIARGYTIRLTVDEGLRRSPGLDCRPLPSIGGVCGCVDASPVGPCGK